MGEHIDNFGALELQVLVLVSALRLNYKTCEGSGERKNQILAPSSTTLALWNFRSRFFSISALRFEGPGSLAFRLFGSKVLVLLRQLRSLTFSSTFWF
ncbi:unnamed protein product [Rhizophagus irregularis]|nr:unnamed protein product [Rhizophagus irregularis]CAB5309227.1 unnamed protein product [Rhizophagus irregularis]